MFEGALREALFAVLIFSSVPLGCSLFIGLVIGFLQAATQIQEQSAPFVAKMLTMFLVIALLGGVALDRMIAMTQEFIISASVFGRTP